MEDSVTDESDDWNLYTTLGLVVAEGTRVELALSDLIGKLLWSSPGSHNVGRGERMSALVGLIQRITEGSIRGRPISTPCAENASGSGGNGTPSFTASGSGWRTSR